MTYCLIGLSQYGKTHLAKELIKRLQDEAKVPTIVQVLVSFPDEWKKSNKNSDKEIYIKPGNQLEIYDKSKGDYKLQLKRLCNRAFSDDIRNKYKIVFIDDQTANIQNRDPLITKLYSEGRHSYIQLIQCLHYLNAIHVNNKAHIRDFVLFGGQIYDKMKKFYVDLIGQHFDRETMLDKYGKVKQEEYNVDKFISDYNDFVGGGLAPDDPAREKYFHNCFQISLPTKQSATAEMIKIYPDKQNEVGIKNGIFKLLEKDLKEKKLKSK